jgi:hypothetical protein
MPVTRDFACGAPRQATRRPHCSSFDSFRRPSAKREKRPASALWPQEDRFLAVAFVAVTPFCPRSPRRGILNGVGRLGGLARHRLLPWLFFGALAAALIIVIVVQRSTASDRDRTAESLGAARGALARRTAEVKRLKNNLRSTRVELRQERLLLAAPRRALLRNRRFQIAFIRGAHARGSAIVVASADATIERTLVGVGDLHFEVFGKRTPIGSFDSSCQRGVVFRIQTDWGQALLLENGELRRRVEGECLPTAHGGTTLIFDGNTVIARHGKMEKKLFTTEGVGNTNRDWVTLSPDGKRVVFELWAAVVPPSYGVQVMNTRTRQQLALAPSLPEWWSKERLAWSPDSQRIAVTLRSPSAEDFFGDLPRPPSWLDGAKEGIVIIDRRGRILARIPNAADAAWSGDGRMIAFDSNRGGHREIYVANADGSGVRQVTHAAQASWLPHWR